MKPHSHSAPHYQWLDFLRFLAALIVVLSHVRGFLFVEYSALDADSRGLLSAAFYAITRLGHEAVIVFFVLSGYLVGGKTIEKIIRGTFNPADYAIDRLTRIWIPLIPALILSAIATGNKDGISTWAGNLLGLQGVLVPNLGQNGPLWSLAYEIWFYILAYSVGRQSTRKSIDILSLTLITITTLIFTKLAIQYLICWLIGALFYIKPHHLSPLKSLTTTCVLSAAAIAGLQLTGSGDRFMALFSESPTLKAGLEIILATSTGFLCATLSTLRPMAISAAAVPLAAFSYTLYLTHYPLLILIRESGFKLIANLNMLAFATFGITVGSCILAARIIYFISEKNTGLIRETLKARLNPFLTARDH